MGLIALPGLGIQYFSFSEEIIALTTQFLKIVSAISTIWFLIIFGLTAAFIIIGVVYRIASETEEVFK